MPHVSGGACWKTGRLSGDEAQGWIMPMLTVHPYLAEPEATLQWTALRMDQIVGPYLQRPHGHKSPGFFQHPGSSVRYGKQPLIAFIQGLCWWRPLFCCIPLSPPQPWLWRTTMMTPCHTNSTTPDCSQNRDDAFIKSHLSIQYIWGLAMLERNLM